jgi:hypothetical protein
MALPLPCDLLLCANDMTSTSIGGPFQLGRSLGGQLCTVIVAIEPAVFGCRQEDYAYIMAYWMPQLLLVRGERIDAVVGLDVLRVFASCCAVVVQVSGCL